MLARPQCARFGRLVSRLGPACRRIGLLGLLALVLSGYAGATRGKDDAPPDSDRKILVFEAGSAHNFSQVFSPDGRVLATTGHSATLWDATNGQLIRAMTTPLYVREIFAFSPDGLSLATNAVGDPFPPKSMLSYGFSVIDVATDKVRDVASPYGTPAMAFDFAPAGDIAVALYAPYAPWETARIAVYDTKTWQVVRVFVDDREIYPFIMALSPDNRHLAVIKNPGLIQLWDYRKGELVREFKGHIGKIITLDFSRDGSFLAIICNGIKLDIIAKKYGPNLDFKKYSLTVWDVNTGELVASKYPWNETTKLDTTLAFSRTTERLAVRTGDGITIFRDAYLNFERQINARLNFVNSIKFSPLNDVFAVSERSSASLTPRNRVTIFSVDARDD